jgi:hypothetical protein
VVLPDHSEDPNDSQRLEYKEELEELVLLERTKLAQKSQISNDNYHKVKSVPNQLEVAEIVRDYLYHGLDVVNDRQNVADNMQRMKVAFIHCVVSQCHQEDARVYAAVDENVKILVVANLVRIHLFAVRWRLLLRFHFDPDHLLVLFDPEALVARHE